MAYAGGATVASDAAVAPSASPARRATAIPTTQLSALRPSEDATACTAVRRRGSREGPESLRATAKVDVARAADIVRLAFCRVRGGDECKA